MKTIKLFTQIFLVAFVLSSCKVMYVPNTQNVPLMEEKGDLKAVIGTKDLQVAYAISDHIGIMVNGYYNKTEWTLSSGAYINEYLSSRFLAEGGVGYFTKMGEKGRFETYAGAGYGGAKYNYDLTDNGTLVTEYMFGANLLRYFVQPAIGIQGDHFGLAFSSRFAGVSFSGITNTNYTPAELEAEGLHELDGNMFMFLEPALTLRVGLKYVQLQIQPYYNLQLAGPESIQKKNYGLNAGLYFSIDEFFKK